MQRVKMMKKYADFILQKALPPRFLQNVMIFADVSMHVFAEYFTGELYKAKAHKVRLFYYDTEVDRFSLMNTPETRLNQVFSPILAALKEAKQENFTVLALRGPSSSLEVKFPLKKEHRYVQEVEAQALQDVVDYKKGSLPCLEIAVPTKAWARSTYPSLTPVQSMDRLWKAIYEKVGLLDHPAESEYPERAQDLARIASKLDALSLDKLIVSDEATGTKLALVLPVRHRWVGPLLIEGEDVFYRRFPDLSVSTAPHSHGATGVLFSTAPFSFHGQRIKGAKLNFENGKITSYEVKEGEEVFKKALKVDEFSVRLGGISLVDERDSFSKDEPFEDEILDEGRTTHLTLGKSSYRCFENGYDKTSRELQSHGLNQSALKLNVPIGSNTLFIAGESQGGKSVPIVVEGKIVL